MPSYKVMDNMWKWANQKHSPCINEHENPITECTLAYASA